jgi:hypothetical protein
MDEIQSFKMYEDIANYRIYYEKYADSHGNYKNTLRAFEKLLFELDYTLTYSKIRMLANSRLLTEDLLIKTAPVRLDFVYQNRLHDLDVENLCSILYKNIGNNIAALELFPGIGQFLPHVVASEPLYIVDRYAEVNEHASKSLNNEFYSKRRLLKYTVNDFDLSHLPQESFGLVYCFNEFFYTDQWYIHSWAKEVYKLLYNGGKFIFNFIPHDESWAVLYNINLTFGVIDYRELISELEKLGFELENYKIQPARSSYIVVKKPGDSPEKLKISGSTAEIIDI